VVGDGVWLHARADVAGRLPTGQPTGEDETWLRYRGDPKDEAFIVGRGVPPIYLVSRPVS
jgi:hypothetical protein